MCEHISSLQRPSNTQVNFSDREKALEQRHKIARKKILPFETQYHPVLPQEPTHGEMAPYTEPTISEKYLQQAFPAFISQRKIPKRRSSKSLTIKA